MTAVQTCVNILPDIMARNSQNLARDEASARYILFLVLFACLLFLCNDINVLPFLVRDPFAIFLLFHGIRGSSSGCRACPDHVQQWPVPGMVAFVADSVMVPVYHDLYSFMM